MIRRSLMFIALATACGGSRSDPAETSPSTTARPATPPAAAADPSTLRYAAGNGRYKVETNMQVAQDMMGNVQEVSSDMMMILSTTLTEESGNLLLAATLDSVTFTGSMPGLDGSAFNAARGRTFRARFTPAGRPVAGANPDSGDALMTQLSRGVREFLAVLPATIAAGGTWTDTVSETAPIPGGSGTLTTRSIRNNRVVGWETRDGARALHLTVQGSYTMSGSGEVQGGTAVEMTGSGTATADRWVSAAGVLLSSTGRDSTNLTVNVPSVGMTIPIRQVQRTTITRLQ